jgi:Raf kinase inhibitor-like YbhB/YbcL family protein
MEITSTAFEEGATIPKQYTGDGRDASPPLRWSGAPGNTQSIALICDDPDAPRKEPWVHWVLFNLPADTHELPEAVPATETLSQGGKQGKNDFGKIGYGGPAPPRGKTAPLLFQTLRARFDAEPAGWRHQATARAGDEGAHPGQRANDGAVWAVIGEW